MGAQAIRWTCARCEVSAGRMDGEPEPLPETWTEALDVTYCLSCSRTRAGEAAVGSAPDSCSREDRVKLQRSALIAFEIARTPEAPNRVIANACRTSAMAVAAVRKVSAERPAPIDHAVPGAA
jgi:hypothetical protein